jgi:ABC-type polysaccharide/polyol phosphate export permease
MVPIINSCVQIAFFITPISWMPRLLDQNPALLRYNPLVYLLEVVRAPLLGEIPSLMSLFMVVGMALCGCLLSFFVFIQVRARIAFWVD